MFLLVDPGGRLSFIRSEAVDGTSRVVIDTSVDRGASWQRTIPMLGNGSQAMPLAASPSADHLGILWYEADQPGLTGDIDATWHMRYAAIEGLGSGNETIVTDDVSDTVHEGDICVAGPACGARDGDRRLLDYPWLAFDVDGRAHLAFASTLWDRPSAFPLYTRGVTSADGST